MGKTKFSRRLTHTTDVAGKRKEVVMDGKLSEFSTGVSQSCSLIRNQAIPICCYPHSTGLFSK